MTATVFVSHSSQDRPVADAVAAALERGGLRAWIAPRDIAPGSSWGEAIIAGIDASRAMVVVVSAAAIASRQVARELERADSRRIPLVPFRIEDVSPTGAAEYFLGGYQWLDAFGAPLERHLDGLVAAVARLVGSERPASAAIAPEPPAVVEIAPDDWSRSPGRRRGVFRGGS